MPDPHQDLAAEFAAHRSHLRKVALRMLGSSSEADDAVQEAWLHLVRADVSGVVNLRGWLTTTIARLCLDLLRARRARREAALDEVARRPDRGLNPEEEAALADSIGAALSVMLETLAPAERIAFVLHDFFALPFEEIAPIVERAPAAARQLASRARRRIQGVDPEQHASVAVQREVVAAFFAACRQGDLQGLLAVLAPDAVLRADASARRLGAKGELLGAEPIAQAAMKRARGVALALIDGKPGAVYAPGGRPMLAFDFIFDEGTIVRIDLLADRETLAQLDIVYAEA